MVTCIRNAVAGFIKVINGDRCAYIYSWRVIFNSSTFSLFKIVFGQTN